MAIPSGAPPGRTVVSAVEACVKASAPSHEELREHRLPRQSGRQDVEEGGGRERDRPRCGDRPELVGTLP